MRVAYSKSKHKWLLTNNRTDLSDVDLHEELDNETLKKKLLHVLVDGTVTTLPYMDEMVALLSRDQLLEKNTEKPVHVVLFTSRNKDNREVHDFKQRHMAFTTDKTPTELMDEFDKFVKDGLPGEISRFYYSVNARDNLKTQRALAHELFDDKPMDMSKLQKYLSSLALKTENRASSHWLFDYDNQEHVDAFVEDVKQYVDNVQTHKTPNGYAVIVEHGFDTRALLEKWKHVEAKRDGMLCVSWNQKVVSNG